METTTSSLFPEGIDVSKVGKYDKFINFQKVVTYDENNVPIDVEYRVPETIRFRSSTLESENLSVPETQYALKKMIGYLDAVIEKEVDEKMKYFRLRFLERVRRKYSYDFLKNGLKPYWVTKQGMWHGTKEHAEQLNEELKLKSEEPSSDALTQPISDS